MKKRYSDNLPEQLYTARACREIDNRVIASGSVTGYELMSRAGQFTFDCICQQFADVSDMVILCGTGNNGGDGYIVAGLAARRGLRVSVYAYGPPTTVDSKTARQYAQAMGAQVIDCTQRPDLSAELNTAGLIVDALLGTGVDRTVTGYMAHLVEWVNNSNQSVVACDIATGLNSDSGCIMGCCIKANSTQTYIALKTGLFTASGKAQSGCLQFSNLGLVAEDYRLSQPAAMLMNRANIARRVKNRSEDAHKGTTGYAAVIGGAPGMAGAVLMAAKAAYRTGCGRVKVLSHIDHAFRLALYCPELMTVGCEEPMKISHLFSEFDAIAVGPGLGQSDWAKCLYSQALQSELPMVVDADGLNLLSQNPDRCEHWILTPHPGEAARLLNCNTADINHDRFAAAKEIVSQYGGVCVLKGSGTLIAAENCLTHVCGAGNAGQATAGMGDVLSGCILSFIAQGYTLFDAACIGSWCHAAAADNVAQTAGKIGMMATDLLAPMQTLHNELIDG